jgi:lipopolysaccharide export system permease protein
LSLTPEFIQTVLYKVDNLSLTGLLKYSRFLAQQGLDTATFMLSFWSKLFQPLAAISLVIVGAAFVFGPLRSVTVGQRTITGIVVGLLFKFSQELIAPTSQIVGFPPVMAALIPILISLMVGLWLLARVR